MESLPPSKQVWPTTNSAVPFVEPIPSSTAISLPNPQLNRDGHMRLDSSFIRQAIKNWFHDIRGRLLLIIRYVIASNHRNYRSFIIGLITVVLVVLFLSLVQNVLIRSSIVFVKLSEDTIGQFDLVLTPNGESNPYLNYTQLNHTLSTVPLIQGAVPRWLIPVNISVSDPESWQPSTNDPVVASAYLLIIDSQLENQVGVGVAWPHRTLSEGEAHVTGSLLRTLKRRPEVGDRINLKFNALSLLNNNVSQPTFSQQGTNVTLTSTQVDQTAFVLGVSRQQLLNGAETLPDGRYRITLGGNNNNNPTLTLDSLTTLSQPMTVISAIDKPQGKYPQAFGNVIVVDRAPTEVLFKRTLYQLLSNPIISSALNMSTTQLETFRLNDYAMSIVIMVNDRNIMYSDSNENRQRTLIRVTDQMALAMGIDYPADVTDVLNQALKATQFIQIYMNEIFFTVISVLSLIAILLIYSLLLSDIEEKTFEFGMLRSLGMRLSNLISLLTFQSLWFSVPGITIGLLLCFVLYIPIEYILCTFTATPLSVALDRSAVALGLTLGFILPVFGMLVPIQRALSQSLRNSLDLFHNSVNDSVVKITKLKEIGINIGENMVSLLLVIVGFLVYYIIPLSFTYNNLSLFFRILTIILIGMVIGQVLIGQTLQHMFELIAMRLTIFIIHGTTGPRSTAIINVVTKNLGAHVKRNSTTALMMTLLLAYIIFAAVQFRVQENTLSQTLEWQFGADIVVRGSSFQKPVPESRISNHLVNRVSDINNSPIQGWTYISYPVNYYWPVQSSKLGPLATLVKPTVRLVGIQQNFLNVSLDKYFIPVSSLNQIDPNDFPRLLNSTINKDPSLFTELDFPIINPYDLMPGTPNVTSIYSSSLPIVISEALANGAYIGSNMTNLVLEVEYRTKNGVNTITQSLLARPLAIIRKVPGIPGISRFVQSRSPVLISMSNAALLFRKIDSWSGADLFNTNVTRNEYIDPRVHSYMPDLDLTVPKQTALIRLKPELSSVQVEGIINDLNTAIGDDDFRLDNLRYQLESTQLASFFINILFYIVAFVGIVLAFFVVWLSFTANLRENAWEFGVLRAIGVDNNTVINIYIYEAIGIILATIVLGSTIGIVTALTLTLQFGLFTEMPFSFEFPTSLYITVVLASLFVAILGSWVPATELAQKKIALALKGL